MIRNGALENILTPAGLFAADVSVNLFVASKGLNRLKKVNLADLTPEQQTDKLHKWVKNNRFVAVVEKDDAVYAFASPQVVEGLQSQPLTINNKQVTVKELSDEESERLSVVIGETFNDFNNNLIEELQEDQKREEVSRERRESARASVREYFASAELLSDLMKIDYLILQMRNLPTKVIQAFLKKMNEMRLVEERRKKEDAIHEDVIAADRKHDDLKKRIRKDEVNNEEIKGQNQKLDQVSEVVRKRAPAPVASKSKRNIRRN